MNKKIRKRKIKVLMKIALPEEILMRAPSSDKEYESDLYLEEGLSKLTDFSINQNKLLSDLTGLGIRDLAAIFDPTGVLSIPDIDPAIEEYETNPTIMNGFFMVASISVIAVS